MRDVMDGLIRSREKLFFLDQPVASVLTLYKQMIITEKRTRNENCLNSRLTDIAEVSNQRDEEEKKAFQKSIRTIHESREKRSCPITAKTIISKQGEIRIIQDGKKSMK